MNRIFWTVQDGIGEHAEHASDLLVLMYGSDRLSNGGAFAYPFGFRGQSQNGTFSMSEPFGFDDDEI